MSLVDAAWRLALRLAYPVRRAVFACLRRGRGGVALAIRTDDELLVVRHSYRPGLGLPGGGMDAGETPEEAVCREAFEELGLSVPPDALRFLGTVRTGFRGPACRNRLFEWRVRTLPTVRIDHRELIWAGPVRPATIPRTDGDVTLRWYLRRCANLQG